MRESIEEVEMWVEGAHSWGGWICCHPWSPLLTFVTLLTSSNLTVLKQLKKNYCLFTTIIVLKWFIYLLLNLFLAVLVLHCCAWALSSCGEWELLFIAEHGLLTVVAYLVAELGCRERGLQELWCTGSVVPCRVESSQARDQTRVSCGGRWVLNHCTTTEVLNLRLLVMPSRYHRLSALPWTIDLWFPSCHFYLDL